MERLIGSIRRECLDHVIVFNERYLMRLLRSHFGYHNKHRTHMGLDGKTPEGRGREPPGQGEVIAIPQVGGLHNR